MREAHKLYKKINKNLFILSGHHEGNLQMESEQ